jgi:hypothetical protein
VSPDTTTLTTKVNYGERALDWLFRYVAFLPMTLTRRCGPVTRTLAAVTLMPWMLLTSPILLIVAVPTALVTLAIEIGDEL